MKLKKKHWSHVRNTSRGLLSSTTKKCSPNWHEIASWNPDNAIAICGWESYRAKLDVFSGWELQLFYVAIIQYDSAWCQCRMNVIKRQQLTLLGATYVIVRIKYMVLWSFEIVKYTHCEQDNKSSDMNDRNCDSVCQYVGCVSLGFVNEIFSASEYLRRIRLHPMMHCNWFPIGPQCSSDTCRCEVMKE